MYEDEEDVEARDVRGCSMVATDMMFSAMRRLFYQSCREGQC